MPRCADVQQNGTERTDEADVGRLQVAVQPASVLHDFDTGKPIEAESSIRVHVRKLGGLYRKYKGCLPERSLMDHLRNVIRSETTKTWKLRCEPKIKPIIGPDFFIYHLYYHYVRDTSAFPIGLDRIDDVCLRQFYMYTGCRKHELIYAKPRDLEEKVKEYDEESDTYTDVDCTADKYIRPRVKTCWVCDEPDECENNPKLKILCWEDIDLWILRDPEKNGGRDRLGMELPTPDCKDLRGSSAFHLITVCSQTWR